MTVTTSATGHAGDVLAMLIAPLTREQFFAECFERRVHRTHGHHPAVDDLLSMDRIDELISDSELPPNSLSMAKSGESVPPAEYTFDNGIVDRGAVLDNFRDGATIILPQLHYADGKLYQFCLALEREFGARVQTNIYLTPPGSTGFGIHYDDHDVFVIQVAGAKQWEIYGDRDGLPYKGESFRKDHDETGELRDSFVLNPGECLYVPRGTAHRAPNHGTEPSLHITVGILVQTWAEFMLEAVAEASLRIPDLRHSLPRSMFFNSSTAEGAGVADNEATFRRLIRQIAETASFDATRAAFSGNFVRSQGTRTRGALLALAKGIAPDDRFTVREHILYSFETAPVSDGDGEGEDVEHTIVLAGSSIPMSANLAPQLQERIGQGSLAMADFAVEDEEELADIIGTLVAYGLLRP
ncbi:hypothetical protein GRI62_02635 [Erythrobacter arachoides]|uniref:JmjC domain-containing protein n=1 Tax=Aurantiacibacter arachoides TaxID=1850444 RepID=A0A844ZZ38_9SPHN|nr:cupin domain-containing protein [Aurantiacibacter arachoides]MXO92502.1 hypothetical protein [Aurantiacibacter arachoides]GGD56674.1 hypothetical protein GCM10011411_15870 [Aurantiacibacter arachoides]